MGRLSRNIVIIGHKKTSMDVATNLIVSFHCKFIGPNFCTKLCNYQVLGFKGNKSNWLRKDIGSLNFAPYGKLILL